MDGKADAQRFRGVVERLPWNEQAGLRVVRKKRALHGLKKGSIKANNLGNVESLGGLLYNLHSFMKPIMPIPNIL